jgi:ADP-heptose:LPS heptosyltransferase
MKSLAGEKIKKIMIHSTNWIGDAVMTTPAMDVLRSFFPTAEIVVVANPLVAIFGPTDYTTTSPMTTKTKLIRKDTPCTPCLLRQCPKDHQCMQAVTADEVFQAAAESLDKPQ